MRRDWSVAGFPREIRVIPAWGVEHEPGGRIAPEVAARAASDWFPSNQRGARFLSEILSVLGSTGSLDARGGFSMEHALERVRRALLQGELHAYRASEPRRGGGLPSGPEPPRARIEAVEEETFVEFVFEYPDGSPVTKEPYTLHYPNGKQESGTLNAEGVITKNRVPAGTYSVVLKEIESVDWQSMRARAFEDIKLRALVTGFAPGAAAKVKIFHEFRETDAQAIKTLSARVEDDQIEAVFRYEPPAEEKPLLPTARLIAEISLEDGARWGKTLNAIEIELPMVIACEVKPRALESGENVTLSAQVSGYPDGTKARFDLYRKSDTGQKSEPIGSIDSFVKNGRAEAICAYRLKDDDGYKKGDISREGEYFCEVVLLEGAKRKGRSRLFWCSDRTG